MASSYALWTHKMMIVKTLPYAVTHNVFSEILKAKFQERLGKAGLTWHESRISHLSLRPRNCQRDVTAPTSYAIIAAA